MSPRPRMYVLDTNVLSEFAHKRPNQIVLDWIAHMSASVSIPFSAVVEIERGIVNLAARNALRASELAGWLDVLLASDMPFLGMDAEVARLYAKMTMVPALRDLWTTPSGTKEPKLGQDLAIAAVAIVKEAPIATMNTRDFVRIDRHFPLPGLYNPAMRKWCIALRTKPSDRDGFASGRNRLYSKHSPPCVRKGATQHSARSRS